MIVLGEELVVNIHQLTLADRSGSLLGRRVLRPLAQIELAKSHSDSAGGDENDLVSHVLEVAQHLAETLHALDV